MYEISRNGTRETDSVARSVRSSVQLLSIEVGDPTVRTSDEFLANGNPARLSASWKPMAVTGVTPILLPEMGPPDRSSPGRRTDQKYRRPGGTLSGFPRPGRGKRHPNEPHRCES